MLQMIFDEYLQIRPSESRIRRRPEVQRLMRPPPRVPLRGADDEAQRRRDELRGHEGSEPGVLLYRPREARLPPFSSCFSSGSEQAVAFPKHTPHASSASLKPSQTPQRSTLALP